MTARLRFQSAMYVIFRDTLFRDGTVVVTMEGGNKKEIGLQLLSS